MHRINQRIEILHGEERMVSVADEGHHKPHTSQCVPSVPGSPSPPRPRMQAIRLVSNVRCFSWEDIWFTHSRVQSCYLHLETKQEVS